MPAAFALRKGSKYGRHSSMAEIDLGANYIHICVDVQNVFAKDTEWRAPWLVRVLPAIEAISEKYSDRTIFTRFIPPRTPEEAAGAWQAYYQRWRNMTRDRLASDLLDLVPALQRLVPPARIVDKRIYSPWLGTGLHHNLRNAGIDTMAPMATLNPEAFERVIDINLNGVWRSFRAGLPYVQKRQGYLMGISSMAAFVHSPLQASYTSSKAGVWALCDSVRLELQHLGVGVGSVHPTFFPTPMMDDVVADPAGHALWGGNDKGIWKMVSRESVVRNIVAGIEQRADMVVVPKRNTLIAKAPGLFRRFIERAGFRGKNIQKAIELASSTGWNLPAERQDGPSGNLDASISPATRRSVG